MGRLFGTNGVRGVINEFLTPQLVLDLGRAIGTVVGKGLIAISRDSRMGGEMLTNALVSALISTGCSVVDIGPAPTPTLQFMVPRLDCVGGVVVTASHNPPNFNGLKVMGPSGIEVPRDVEDQIEDIYFKREFKVADWKRIGSVRSYDTAMKEYLDAIKSHVDVKKIRQRQLTVVVDCANSVGSLATPILLRDLGCKVVSINSQLDGTFPGRNPEPTPENVSDLRCMVTSIKADLGVAHDGDADRATFVDETGRVLWGDQSFAIVASYVLAQKPDSTLVTPVSSGKLIEDVARQAGAKVEWTEVGSVVVSHRIEEIGAELGGEENGGVFFPAHLAARDGAMTVALIVDIMAKEEKQLSDLVSELPMYFSDKRKVPVPPEKKEAILDALILLTKEHNRITMDGVKLILDDGWILMRPSGTEPLWRCFAEGKTQETAERLCKMGVELIQAAITKS